MSFDYARISVTAKLTAYYRQFSDIPFARDAARVIGADAAVEEIARTHALDLKALMFYAPMFEARYKSVGALVRAAGAPQVLELASGYSLRGLELAQSVRYIEADLPDVIATKTALVTELRLLHGLGASPTHELVAANALDLAQLREAVARLDHSVPTTVVCEGLLMYLSRAEIHQLATNISSVLSDFIWITPDFAFKNPDVSPERKRLREAITGVTDRHLDAGAFEDVRALEQFLAELGLDVTVQGQIETAGHLSSVAALGLSQDVVERLRPALRIWTIQPRNFVSGSQ